MNRALLLLVIGLVFGGAGGVILAASKGITLDGHDHLVDHAQASKAGHDHSEMIEVAGPVPRVTASVETDPDAGWNLRVDVSDFRFAPEKVGSAHVPGEGHAHVYVNGIKIARLYGAWMHIGSLPEGRVEVRVSLSSNDHKGLAVKGKAVEALVEVVN